MLNLPRHAKQLTMASSITDLRVAGMTDPSARAMYEVKYHGKRLLERVRSSGDSILYRKLLAKTKFTDFSTPHCPMWLCSVEHEGEFDIWVEKSVELLRRNIARNV